MQLTEEGFEELEKFIKILESVDLKFQQKFSGINKKILPFTKQDNYFDYVYELFIPFMENEFSKEELKDKFKEILFYYYKKYEGGPMAQGH